MGVLKFDGINDYVLFNAASSALQAFPQSGHTMVAVMRRASTTPAWYGLITGETSGAAYRATLEISDTGPAIIWDQVTSTYAGTTNTNVSDATDWHLVAASKQTGANPVTLTNKNITTGAAVGRDTSGALNDAAAGLGAGGLIRLGMWQTTDPLNGWMAVAAIWNVRLTNAQIDECFANKRTSDLWNNSAGPPLVLIELNTLTPVDLGGNCTFSTLSGPVLDAAETAAGWTFDGKGALPPATAQGQYGWGTYGAGNYGAGFGAALAGTTHNGAATIAATSGGTFGARKEARAAGTIAAVSGGTIGARKEARGVGTIAATATVTSVAQKEARATSTIAATATTTPRAGIHRTRPWRLLGMHPGLDPFITAGNEGAFKAEFDACIGFQGSPQFELYKNWFPTYSYWNLFSDSSGAPHEVLQLDAGGESLWLNFAMNPDGTFARRSMDLRSSTYKNGFITLLRNTIDAGAAGMFIDDVNMNASTMFVRQFGGAPTTDFTSGTYYTSAITGRTGWKALIADFLTDVVAQVKSTHPQAKFIFNTQVFWLEPDRWTDPDAIRMLDACDWIIIEHGFADPGLHSGVGSDTGTNDYALRSVWKYIDKVHSRGKGVITYSRGTDLATGRYETANYMLKRDYDNLENPDMICIHNASYDFASFPVFPSAYNTDMGKRNATLDFGAGARVLGRFERGLVEVTPVTKTSAILATQSGQEIEVAADSPAAWWKLNDLAAPADDAVGSLNMTANGSPVFDGQGGVLFPTGSDTLTVSDNTGPTNLSGSAWTLEFEVTAPSAYTPSTFPNILSKGWATVGGYYIYVHETNGRVNWYGNTEHDLLIDLAASETARLAFVFNGTHLIGYKNGIETSRVAYSNAGMGNSDPFTVNGGNQGGDPAGYRFSDISVYTTVVPEARLRAHYVASVTLPIDGAATIPGTSAASGLAMVDHRAATTIVAASTVTPATSVDHRASATIAATSGATVAGFREARSQATIVAGTTVTAGAISDKRAAATIAATSTVTAGSRVERRGVATVNGISTASAAGSVLGAYPSAILASGDLTGYWRLGENSGTIAYDERGIYNGSYEGSYSLGFTGALVGDGNTAASFPGFAVVRVSGFHDFLYNDPFTIELWAKPGDNSSYRTIFSRNDGWNAIYINTTPGGYIAVGRTVDGNSEEAYSSNPLAENAWSHLAFTYDGSNMYIYINGAYDGENASFGYMSSFISADMLIGGDEAIGQYFYGELDEVAIYTYALSGPELEAHYTLGAGNTTGSASIAATSNVAPVARVEKRATATIAAVSGGTISGYNQVPGAGNIPAVSTVTAGGLVERRGAATVAAQSGMTVAGEVNKLGALTVTGQSAVTAVARAEHNGVTSIASTSGGTATGQAVHNATTSVGALSNATATSMAERRGSVVIGATSSTSIDSHSAGTQTGQVTITGQASISATAQFTGNGRATIASTSGGTIGGFVERRGLALVNATSGGSAVGRAEQNAQSTMVSGSTVTAGGFKESRASGLISSQSAVAAAAYKESLAALVVAAQSTVTVAGRIELNAQIIIAAQSQTDFSSSVILTGQALIAATSGVTAAPQGRPVIGMAILRSWSTVKATVGQTRTGTTYVAARGRVTATGTVSSNQAKIDAISGLIATPTVVGTVIRSPRRVMSGRSGVRGSRVRGGVR